ncbi:MAG: dephospho-CoA kinase [Geminicoccaceae bacterium]
MLILGLTGSIAMGKSRAAAMFRAFGVPVFDADATVHALFAPGGAAVAPVEQAFPGTRTPEGAIDRVRLGQRVMGDAPALARLEKIVHPLVRAAEGRFLRRCSRAGVSVAVLDIPLLFETDGEHRVDRVAVVSANREVQTMRALRRPGMTRTRLDQIRGKQLPDAEKRRRADYVLASGSDRGYLAGQIGQVLADLSRVRPAAWPTAWLRHGVHA